MDDASDEGQKVKKLNASPEVVAWKSKSSYHHFVLDREKRLEQEEKRKQMEDPIEKKILGLADLADRGDLFSKVNKMSDEEKKR